jgi:orotidine 5'-phosphate decarboxylase subfamily 2
MFGFRTKLAVRQRKANTLVCVGLDPLLEKMPTEFKGMQANTALDVQMWMQRIVTATGPFACMFKLQSAHWESILGGVGALRSVIDCIHRFFPDIPAFLDCKRGDIDRTQQRYRVAHFDLIGADGVNFSPYMGKTCMAGLVDERNLGRALVDLCYTSNPDAREVQDALMADGRPSWEHYAEWILQWAKELDVVENAGLVMAAAYENPKDLGTVYSQHLVRCRQLVGDKLWFLIPGIGTQGGFIEETVRAAYAGPGSIAINSSSGIIFASTGATFMEEAANKARELRDAINSAL